MRRLASGVWVELAGSVVAAHGFLGELPAAAANAPVLRHDLEGLDDLGSHPAGRPVDERVEHVVADAVVGIAGQLEQAVPDGRYVGLDVTRAEVAYRHLPDPGVVVVGEREEAVDLLAAPSP